MRATQQIIETSSIEDHAAAIREQVNRSLDDPETRRLSVAVASGSYEWVPDPRTSAPVPVIQYHGRYYRVGPGFQPPPICNARDHDCEIVQVWNFLCTNVRYIGDTDGADTYQDLRTTLEAGGGDCDDFTIAFCAMLRSIGYQCAARIISLDGQAWAHVYSLVQHPKKPYWIPLDATEEGRPLGWESPRPAAIQDFIMD